MSQYRNVNRIFAAVVFLIALITYASTLQPSVPFWDCGEFSAAITWQQVPHPPGSPLWLITARVFQMLLGLFTSTDLGWRTNLAAGVCSAFTAMFTYMITVKVIERWRPYNPEWNWTGWLPTFGAAVIAGLAFTWSDSQWFNSVESEVYAAGIMLVAAMVYLMMRWDEVAEKRGHERYLLLAAFVIGLAIGVHLLALLVVPAIALVIYFRNRPVNGKAFLLSSMVALLPTLFAMWVAIKIVDATSKIGLIAVIPLLAFATYLLKNRPLTKVSWASVLSLGMLMLVTGLGFWFLIYKATIYYIPGLLSSNMMVGVLILAALLGIIWWSTRRDNSLPTVNRSIVYVSAMSMLLIIVGYTTYTHVLIRANAHPPMNENEPDKFSELVNYLSRAQYGNRGDWPRRQETDEYYRRLQDSYGVWYPPVGQNPDHTYRYDSVNTMGELNFMFKYQIGKMYLRYFFWNFMGRVSDVQDASAALTRSLSKREREDFVTPTGYSDVFPITFFALPFLLGLLGLYWHYRKDWKMAFVYTVLFLFLGVIPTLQQNQQQPQPRERDYFYTGSFMIWTIWMGIGAAGLIEVLRRRKQAGVQAGDVVMFGDGNGGGAVVGGVVAFCLLVGPVNMAYNGWKMHDRSGNWVPWDYAYNILQSCQKDAILFTNGDNDTFPLWYIQDVAGVRRDVRVVNLSLGNTGWYIAALKNARPWGAKTVPISFKDESLEATDEDEGNNPRALSYDQGPAPVVTVDVPAEAMAAATKGADSHAGSMSWTLKGSDMGGGNQLTRVQDKLIRDIIENNHWERPIYFSSTVGPDAWAGLDEYFRAEGMAYHVMPVKQASQGQSSIDVELMQKCLTILPDDKFYTDQHYGFKFRNLNNPNTFFMEDHRRIPGIQYRQLYLSLAMYQLGQAKNPQQALATLDAMDKAISTKIFPIAYPFLAQLVQIYHQAGAEDKAQKAAQQAVLEIDALLDAYGDDWQNIQYARNYNPFQVKAEMLASLGRYDEAMGEYQKLKAMYASDANSGAQIQQQIDQMGVEKYLSKKDTAGAMRQLQQLIAGYSASKDPNAQAFVMQYQGQLAQLGGKPITPQVTTSAPGRDSSGPNTAGKK